LWLARDDQGCALIKHGRVGEGLRLVDEVLVAATAGELSPIVTGIVYCNTIATVARHLQNIFAKLGVSSRTAASAFAVEHDLGGRGQLSPRRRCRHVGGPRRCGRALLGIRSP
jgi:hypothetical protein